MADPKAPDGPADGMLKFKGWWGNGCVVRLEDVRAELALYGLHIVSEADRKVLEACADLTTEDLEYWVHRPKSCKERSVLADAELEARKTRAK